MHPKKRHRMPTYYRFDLCLDKIVFFCDFFTERKEDQLTTHKLTNDYDYHNNAMRLREGDQLVDYSNVSRCYNLLYHQDYLFFVCGLCVLRVTLFYQAFMHRQFLHS